MAAPALADADLHHLRSVLRLRVGEPVGATDGRGGLVMCEWTGSGLSASGAPTFVPRETPPLTVGFAPVKGDRPEWAVQKLTELGVDRIVLLRTDRSVVRWEGRRASGHLARLQLVARQAVMQSRRCWLPAVEGLVSVSDALAWGSVALAAPGGTAPSLVCPAILVGPEGGWSSSELSHDVPHVALGPGVLRTETAAVAAGALLGALRSGLVRPAAE